MEAAAHVVVDAPPGHRAEGAGHHPRGLRAGLAPGPLERGAPQQEREVGRPGELGRPAEAPVDGVEALCVVSVRLLEGRARALGERGYGARRPVTLRRPLPQGADHALRLLDEPRAVLPPAAGDRVQYPGKAGAALPVLGRKVGPRVEGLQVRG